MWNFTPFEWGMLGFAGFMLALGIYYAIVDVRRERNEKHNQ